MPLLTSISICLLVLETIPFQVSVFNLHGLPWSLVNFRRNLDAIGGVRPDGALNFRPAPLALEEPFLVPEGETRKYFLSLCISCLRCGRLVFERLQSHAVADFLICLLRRHRKTAEMQDGMTVL